MIRCYVKPQADCSSTNFKRWSSSTFCARLWLVSSSDVFFRSMNFDLLLFWLLFRTSKHARWLPNGTIIYYYQSFGQWKSRSWRVTKKFSLHIGRLCSLILKLSLSVKTRCRYFGNTTILSCSCTVEKTKCNTYFVIETTYGRRISGVLNVRRSVYHFSIL